MTKTLVRTPLKTDVECATVTDNRAKISIKLLIRKLAKVGTVIGCGQKQLEI